VSAERERLAKSGGAGYCRMEVSGERGRGEKAPATDRQFLPDLLDSRKDSATFKKEGGTPANLKKRVAVEENRNRHLGELAGSRKGDLFLCRKIGRENGSRSINADGGRRPKDWQIYSSATVR